MKILILGEDETLALLVKFLVEIKYQYPTLCSTKEKDILTDLSSHGKEESILIYFNSTTSSFLDDALLKREKNPNLKILLLTHSIDPINQKKYQEELNCKIANKSELAESVMSFLDTHISGIPSNFPYCAISTKLLLKFEGIHKNLYIRLGEKKFIQLFREDDMITHQDILRYLQKGVTSLYLTRQTATSILKQLNRQLDIYLKSNQVRFIFKTPSDSPESQFEQRFVRIQDDLYIDNDTKNIINSAIQKVRSKTMKEKRIDIFLSQLFDMPNYFHYFSKKVELSCLLGILIANELKVASLSNIDKISYAAVLCDITLATRPKLIQIRDYEEYLAHQDHLDEIEKKFFLEHPREAAALSSKYFKTSPAGTNSLILNHHEMPDGSGFPNKIKSDKFDLLTAVFIVANDLSHYILTHEFATIDEYLVETTNRWSYVHFRKCHAAVKNLRELNLKYLNKNSATS